MDICISLSYEKSLQINKKVNNVTITTASLSLTQRLQ